MYSPKVNPKFISDLYKEAKRQKLPMTKLINEAIKNYLYKARCKNCLSVIELDEPSDIGFCSFCETNVLLLYLSNQK